MQNGITTAISFKPKEEQASYLFPCEMEIKQDENLAQSLHIDDIMPSRSVDGKDKPQKCTPDSDYYQSQFVRVAKMDGTPEEEDSEENSQEFGKAIAKYLNKMGTSSKYKFMTRFQYCGDVTPAGDLPPPSKYFIDKDVVNLIKYIYPETPLEDITDDDDIVASFFGDDRVDECRALLLAHADYDNATNLEGNGDNDDDEDHSEDDEVTRTVTATTNRTLADVRLANFFEQSKEQY